jgi:hypothetical protein
MSARVGDRIVVEAERSSQSARQGVIEEILQEQPLRCRVHWDDGHESILTPAAGAMWVEPKPRRSQARNR